MAYFCDKLTRKYRMSKTDSQYDIALGRCKDVFLKKNTDYGTSWRILRQASITDQIFIKAQRIRTIEQKGTSEIDEGAESEYIGIINYCVIALIQMELKDHEETNIPVEELAKLYEKITTQTKDLMKAKNSDYGEAWRDMRVSTFTDMILMRLLRIKQIEDNQGQTQVSEGVDANFMDMINYAMFALIRLAE
jgi:hypothetical protein